MERRIEYSVMSQPAMSAPVESLPLCSIERLRKYRQVVVVAPHPDDETLGCGGAIALLRQRNTPVQVLVISDGTQSHPHSQTHPASRLKALREQEAIAACEILGVASAVTFLGWPDASVPMAGEALFERAVEKCARYFQQHAPDLVFVPWKHDQHRDHRATWQIVYHCVQRLFSLPDLLIYPIWGSREAGLPALPKGETGWRLDIRTVRSLKRQAAMAHQSQTTHLICDDPHGFQLTPKMLNNLIQPWEIYLEVQ